MVPPDIEGIEALMIIILALKLYLKCVELYIYYLLSYLVQYLCLIVIYSLSRNRLPMISDDLSHWSDIFTWRQHHYQFIVSHYYSHASQDPVSHVTSKFSECRHLIVQYCHMT